MLKYTNAERLKYRSPNAKKKPTTDNPASFQLISSVDELKVTIWGDMIHIHSKREQIAHNLSYTC